MKVKIYMKVGENIPVYLETVRNEETAALKIRSYENADRYEVTTEGYKNPLPLYFITNA